MDDTHRPAVDMLLVESEARYRAVIENASDMIQSVRPDGTFEFVNRAWHDKLGYAPEELERLMIWDIIHEDSVEHCRELFTRAIVGEAIDSVRATFVTKDEHLIPVEGNATSRFVNGKVVATHSFFRDITERLRAQELEERNARLEREQRARYLEKMAALGKLSAGLSHELNNPAAAAQRASGRLTESLARQRAAARELIDFGVTSEQWRVLDSLVDDASRQLAGQSETDPLETSRQEEAVETWLDEHQVAEAWTLAPELVRAGITAEELERLAVRLPAATLPATMCWIGESVALREHSAIISRSARRISELVSAVKAYSFMDRAAEQVVDVHDGLENTLVILAHRLKNATIRRDYDRSLPPVRAFGSGLNQVWTNILDNALDATEGAGTISIRTRRRDDHAEVEIADDGCGIPAELLTRVFEPFFTMKVQGQGIGLGLDIAWRIVTEEHGGRIEVQSAPGETVFRVIVPLAAAATGE